MSENGIPSRGGKFTQVPMPPRQAFSVRLPDPPFHSWRVYSTAIASDAGPAVMVECGGCGVTGLVRKFDNALWARAFYAPSAPFDLPAGYLVEEAR